MNEKIIEELKLTIIRKGNVIPRGYSASFILIEEKTVISTYIPNEQIFFDYTLLHGVFVCATYNSVTKEWLASDKFWDIATKIVKNYSLDPLIKYNKNRFDCLEF